MYIYIYVLSYYLFQIHLVCQYLHQPLIEWQNPSDCTRAVGNMPIEFQRCSNTDQPKKDRPAKSYY